MSFKSFSVSMGDRFESTYPVKTGPAYETVKGYITNIYLAASKVEVSSPNNEIWVISLDDAITKNIHLKCERL